MAGFTGLLFKKKLAELRITKRSIETLSLWIIHYKRHYKDIVRVWFQELQEAGVDRKLSFMYLANDVIQNSKKKGPDFSTEFGQVLSQAFKHVYKSVSDEKTKNDLKRIIKIWQERKIFDKKKIQDFCESLSGNRKVASSAEKKAAEKRRADDKYLDIVLKYVRPVDGSRKIIVGCDDFLKSGSMNGPPNVMCS